MPVHLEQLTPWRLLAYGAGRSVLLDELLLEHEILLEGLIIQSYACSVCIKSDAYVPWIAFANENTL